LRPTINKSIFLPQMNLKHHGVCIMSPFETALQHCANAPHGIEKLMCLRSALSAHQAISTAATGVVDEGLNGQIRAIDGLLAAREVAELLAA
jgi:hypothetical protein